MYFLPLFHIDVQAAIFAAFFKLIMRGKTTFDNLVKNTDQSEPFKKGRNINLIQRRNETLITAYYYLAKVKRLQYEDTLEKLQMIFFLSNRTIVNIVEENYSLLKTLMNEQPSHRQLQMRLHFINLKTI